MIVISYNAIQETVLVYKESVDELMEIMQYITQNALELIPVLYILGMILKNTERISDRYIPVILLTFGIVGAIAIMGLNIEAIIQGVLVTGATVYANQLVKQKGKDK